MNQESYIILISILVILIIGASYLTYSKLRNNKKKLMNTETSNKLVGIFGGLNNIVSATANNSRLKVVVKNLDLVQQDQLKEIDNQGVFVTNSQVQVIFKENKELIQDFISKVN